MSITETQIIHRLTHSSTSAMSSINNEDDGLIMKIDRTLVNTVRPIIGGGVRTPVSSKMCDHAYSSSISGWIFRAISCLQYAHFSFVKFLNDVNETIEKKVVRVLPIFLYMSLLVLAIQTVVIIALLSQSYLPWGLWFLLTCIGILAGIYSFTAVVLTEPINATTKLAS